MLAGTVEEPGCPGPRQRKLPQALSHLNEAVEISRTIRDRDGEAAALADLVASGARPRELTPTAHQRAESALAAFESVRRAVASPTLRASFFASVRDIQELDIDILMRLHREHRRGLWRHGTVHERERPRALAAGTAS
jgi:hypothetical protein